MTAEISGRELRASVMVPGTVTGVAFVLDEPLSLWGGLNAETGAITDVHHPQHGLSISGCVLVMPTGRGSSSASSVLAEAVRLNTAPIAIVLHARDEIVALGALVAEELYGIVTPVVVVPDAQAAITSGDAVEVDGPVLRIG